MHRVFKWGEQKLVLYTFNPSIIYIQAIKGWDWKIKGCGRFQEIEGAWLSLQAQEMGFNNIVRVSSENLENKFKKWAVMAGQLLC